MFDYLFRKYKDVALQPITHIVQHFSPNTLTVLAFVAGLVCALAAFYGAGLWVLALWLLNRLLDGLDGAVARARGKQSDFGGYLDILLDFAVYAAVPIGLALYQPVLETLIALIFLLGSFYVNGASWMYLAAILEKRAQGAAARGERTTVVMPDGLIGAVTTFGFYCAFCLWPTYLTPLFSMMAAFTFFTAGQRLWWAWRNLRAHKTTVSMRANANVKATRDAQRIQ